MWSWSLTEAFWRCQSLFPSLRHVVASFSLYLDSLPARYIWCGQFYRGSLVNSEILKTLPCSLVNRPFIQNLVVQSWGFCSLGREAAQLNFSSSPPNFGNECSGHFSWSLWISQFTEEDTLCHGLEPCSCHPDWITWNNLLCWVKAMLCWKKKKKGLCFVENAYFCPKKWGVFPEHISYPQPKKKSVDLSRVIYCLLNNWD